MKRMSLLVSLLIVLLWAVLQPIEILSFSSPFMPMRKALMPLLGALAIGWMGISMLLALRPPWLEHRLGGLDKLFKMHKWSGIGAVLLVVTHWILYLSPLVFLTTETIEKIKREQDAELLRALARDMGEWAAWIMIILGVVALLRFVPYGWFRKLHKGFPIAFLIGAYHGVILLPDGMASTPFGVVILAIALVGSVIAVISLAGMIGRSRRYAGRVSGLKITAAGVLNLQVKPSHNWPGHEAGQFAWLTLDRKEGHHPFSIVSDWKGGDDLHFAIKPLGDYTRTLAGRVKVGDSAIVEGPYGRFDFGDVSEEQVWVAGGIGVALFLARLEQLAATSGSKGKVHFFYSVGNNIDATFPDGLEDLCRRAGVELHFRISAVDGHLDPDEIGKFVPNASGVWFCGPLGWAKILQVVLHNKFHLPIGSFHREFFEFR